MKTYDVCVERTVTQWAVITVEAENEEEAVVEALSIAEASCAPTLWTDDDEASNYHTSDVVEQKAGQ